jgi:hypothetical protein
MKKVSFIAFLAAAAALVTSCNKNDDPPPASPIVNLVSTLNGASEVPANGSTARGAVTGTYNKDTRVFSISVTWSGFTATNAHVHKGIAGVSGGVQWGLGNAPFTSPINFTSNPLTDSQRDSLAMGMYYVNIHSAAFPGGEIRGQIVVP